MNLYYCPTCHFIYLASDARDRAFCPDCGQPGTRSATEEQKARYETDRECVISFCRKASSSVNV